MTEIDLDFGEPIDLDAIRATPEYAEEGVVADAQWLLTEAMAEMKVSKADLARRLNVSRARVTQMLSPECKNFTLRLLGRAAHALDIPIKICRADRKAEWFQPTRWEFSGDASSDLDPVIASFAYMEEAKTGALPIDCGNNDFVTASLVSLDHARRVLRAA